ncbi:MAG: hypothetical protein PF693_14135 [Spirochaetia bacterium]|jgi:hypothetical protein|nr:hypothetical protein [Spirochaetia bacterium]
MIRSEIIKGQRSWVLENKSIRLCLTELGGHMAPVVFMKDSVQPIEPFYISPWAEEGLNLENEPEVLVPLRGDFFCLPFGGDNSWNNESHPPHGEVSGNKWALASEQSENSIVLKMDTTARRGSITKSIGLKEGENNLYINHLVEGFTGSTSLGHHAIFPGGTKKYISTSPIKFGYTNKYEGASYNQGEYYSLASLEKFKSLEKVPTVWKDNDNTDCSVFPARKGFVDILQVYNKSEENFAWSAVTVPEEGYLWFSLKDSEILPSTVLWMENMGRHQAPWNGRNVCIGVEDVCSSFADGLAVSAKNNFLNEKGIKTCHQIKEDSGLSVKYIQGVVRIPEGFDKVKTILKKDDGIEITSVSGKKVFTKVNTEFIHS